RRLVGELAGDRLVERPPLRGEQDAAHIWLRIAQRAHGPDHWFRLEHHARAPAELHVIHLTMPSLGVLAQIVHHHLDVPGRERAPDDADTQRAREHIGKDGEHVKADHTVSSVHGTTVIVPAATSTEVTQSRAIGRRSMGPAARLTRTSLPPP